jgi:aminopeptidase YwaD
MAGQKMSEKLDAELEQKAEHYLHFLCTELSNRQTGSEQNRLATEFFASRIQELGFQVEKSNFDCIDWISGDVSLSVDDEPIETYISPFTIGARVEAPLVHLSTLRDLEKTDLQGKIALLTGDLVTEQLMPKNFPFYNPAQHQMIVNALERARPTALIAATGKDPQMAGGLYPFPLFEDGDFDIPSVYIKDVDGHKLATLEGKKAKLWIEARRIPSTGCNVIARKRDLNSPRLVFCAHIDAKAGTPGALDNATGITTLLLLAERLHEYSKATPVEIVALNGEDHYAASGEIEYLRSSLGPPQGITLAINIDGAGFKEGRTSYSFYGVAEGSIEMIRSLFSAYPDLGEGPQWYQSDHSIFIQQNIPAMAFTSDQFDKLWSEIAHTPADRPEIVSPNKLVHLSEALYDLVMLENR